MNIRSISFLIVTWLLCFLAAGYFISVEWKDVQEQIQWFPDSVQTWQYGRLVMIGFLCLMPVLGLHIYYLGNTLDRYMARLFLKVLALCLTALFGIWLLMDLSENISDFQDSPHMLKSVLLYYFKTTPATLMLLLPYVLLLSLSYHLRKLSTDRELIAMVQTGKSLLRILLPQLVIGLFCALGCIGLNYHLAPQALSGRDAWKQKLQGKAVQKAENVLYFQAEPRRLWFIEEFESDLMRPLKGVHISQTSASGELMYECYAKSAWWDRSKRTWTFQDVEEVIYEHEGLPKRHQLVNVTQDWSETPAQLIQPGLPAADLGLPDLTTWLQENEKYRKISNTGSYLTHWHYRWALPMSCLVIVLLTAPMAIDFSRKTSAGSTLLAIGLVASMMLCASISLSLGESAYLPPWLAAWLPNVVFTGVALYFMVRRMDLRLFKRESRTA